MDIKKIKEKGRLAFKANYWECVIVAFLLSVLTTGTIVSVSNQFKDVDNQQAVIIISCLLRLFLFNPIQVGGYRFFKKNTLEKGVSAGIVKEGFGAYGHTVITLLLKDLFVALWSLLLIIPGIVKAYSYMLVPYLIKDNPELSPTEMIARSRELMNGHKWEAFVLDLSFIGWFLLGGLTLNLVNIFWTNPYHESARARFYLNLLHD